MADGGEAIVGLAIVVLVLIIAIAAAVTALGLIWAVLPAILIAAVAPPVASMLAGRTRADAGDYDLTSIARPIIKGCALTWEACECEHCIPRIRVDAPKALIGNAGLIAGSVVLVLLGQYREALIGHRFWFFGETHELPMELSALIGLGMVVAASVLSTRLVADSVSGEATLRLRDDLRRRVRDECASAQVADLQRHFDAAEALARGMSGQPPENYTESARKLADDSRAKYFGDEKVLQSLIDEIRQRAETDVSWLQKCKSAFDSTLSALADARMYATRTGNTLLATAVEDFVHRSRGTGSQVSQRAWQHVIDALRRVRIDCENLRGDRSPPGRDGERTTASGEPPRDRPRDRADRTNLDPYSVLGASPSMTDEEITSLYKKLLLIYHPDKGNVRDHQKLIEIQSAYKSIMESRRK